MVKSTPANRTCEQVFQTILKECLPSGPILERGLARAQRIGNALRRCQDWCAEGYDLSGSCAKKTAIWPLQDIDILVYLKKEHGRRHFDTYDMPSVLLRRLTTRLEQMWRVDRGRIRVRTQEHSVRVCFSEKRALHVDVVPALWDGNPEGEVLIPERSTERYIRSSVRRQREALQRLDTPSRFLRGGIRLLKLWRNQHDLPLSSYALEVIAMHLRRERTRCTPGAILDGALHWMANTRMQKPISLIDQPLPKNARVVIMDAGVRRVNIARTLHVNDREVIVKAARHALQRLEIAAREMGSREAIIRELLGVPVGR